MGRVWSLGVNSSTELTTPDALIAEVAARQHGVVTIAQLLAARLDRNAIKYRVRVGRLHLLHRGVYAVGHRPPSPLATAIAAVLACGPEAGLSHRSAGALWRLLPRWHKPTEVTAPTKRRHPGIHVHRSRNIDTTVHYGIRVTTPAPTLVDLADVLNPKHLTRALNEALVLRLVTANELASLLTRYRAERLVIELDSRQFHSTPRAFETDRDRVADLLNAGFPTLRITHHRLKHHAAHEPARLGQILER